MRLELVLWALLPWLLPQGPGLQLAPSRSFLMEFLCVMGWGFWLLRLSGHAVVPRRLSGAARHGQAFALALALGVLGTVALDLASGRTGLDQAWAWWAACVVCAATFGAARRCALDADVQTALWWAMLAMGLHGVFLGAVQMFWVDGLDGLWIASSDQLGRAAGNVRQPNQYASLQCWAWCAALGLAMLGRLRFGWLLVCSVLLSASVVWSGSRTGWVAAGLIVAWVWVQPAVAARIRWVTTLQWPWMWLLHQALIAWSTHGHGLYYAGTRAAEKGADVSSGRWSLWHHAWVLWSQAPLTGWGTGQFRVQWAINEVPPPPQGFYGHAHNLFLQWWVEWGALRGGTLSLLLIGLLGACGVVWWQQRMRVAQEGQAVPAFSMVSAGVWGAVLAVVFTHSQLEFPLWLAYFLVPAVWALGSVLGVSSEPRQGASATPSWCWGRASACLILCLGALALWDYQKLLSDRYMHSEAWQDEPLLFRGFAQEARLEKRFDLTDTQVVEMGMQAMAARGNPDVMRRIAEAKCRTAEAVACARLLRNRSLLMRREKSLPP